MIGGTMLSYKPFSSIYTFLILALLGTLLLTYLFGSPLVEHAIASPPQELHFSLITSTRVADGVTLSREVLQTVAGSELVNRLDLDLRHPSIHLSEELARNGLISSDQPAHSTAKRTTAVAGINGDV